MKINPYRKEYNWAILIFLIIGLLISFFSYRKEKSEQKAEIEMTK